MYIVQSQINRKDVDDKVTSSETAVGISYILVFVLMCITLLFFLFFFFLPLLPVVGGELCLPPEEPVVSGSP